MKTVGLLGGMSWESTVPYYQVLNRVVSRELGGLHSARILMVSVDFQPVEELQHQGRWEELGRMLSREARRLQDGGADFLVLCTNTMHLVAPAIQEAISIPFLHIADATGGRILSSGLRRIGLLGTRFTMEEPFYRDRLEESHGLEVLIPHGPERGTVHRIIYEELVLGKVLEESRSEYRSIVDGLVSRGAQGVILGCTEIGLLLRPEDAEVPLFDTALIHAEEAAAFALSGGEAPSPGQVVRR
jgi:aspartate racemase